MGSNLNFKNFGPDQPGNFPLARQSSIYSLTFDEFQSTVGGIGKDFGSMNMDELLKNIWSAEENQNIGSTSGVVNNSGSQEGGGYLQRQGSLTLPRTLSQKTVDEVWRDMVREYSGGDKGSSGGPSTGGFGVPFREPTLGEITLEEFLVRAGVVKEEAQLAEQPKSVDLFGNLSRPVNNLGLGFDYQQQNVNGARSTAQQPPILPKQPTTLAYGAPLMGVSIGINDSALNESMVQNVGLQGGLGMIGLGGNNGVSVATGSPAVSSDGIAKSNGDISSVSPVPYVFNGGLRGRKNAALEKVVERRQKRMIKNRESAARSRARKQAYTMELEAEVAKLKEENELLQKKQAEMMEMQKKQVLEMMNQQNGNKRRCLRRTQTSPW